MGNAEEEREAAIADGGGDTGGGGEEGDGGGDMGGGGEEGLMDFARYGEETNVLAALVAGADPGIYLLPLYYSQA